MKAFKVTYTIDGFEGEMSAGPYCKHDAETHKRDIEGFEGVRNAKVVEVENDGV